MPGKCCGAQLGVCCMQRLAHGWHSTNFLFYYQLPRSRRLRMHRHGEERTNLRSPWHTALPLEPRLISLCPLGQRGGTACMPHLLLRCAPNP